MSNDAFNRLAEKFYGPDPKPPAPSNNPDRDSATRFYEGTLHRDARLLDDDPNVTKSDVDSANETYRQELIDLELSDSEARLITDLIRSHQTKKPTDDEINTWRRENRESLNRAFGDDARERVAELQSLLKKAPVIRRMIDELRLGDHPRLVEALVPRARSVRLRGRLKA